MKIKTNENMMIPAIQSLDLYFLFIQLILHLSFLFVNLMNNWLLLFFAYEIYHAEKNGILLGE